MGSMPKIKDDFCVCHGKHAEDEGSRKEPLFKNRRKLKNKKLSLASLSSKFFLAKFSLFFVSSSNHEYNPSIDSY